MAEDTATLGELRTQLATDLAILLRRRGTEPPYPDSELVTIPIPPGGYPLTMFGAMLEGISRRFPQASWVVNHGFGAGPLVLHLGPERHLDEDFEDDDD